MARCDDKTQEARNKNHEGSRNETQKKKEGGSKTEEGSTEAVTEKR